MEKVRGKIRSILFAIVSIFFAGFAFLLAGCQASFLRGITERGYSINRLIYTDNVAKYTQGKSLLSGEVSWESGASKTTIDFDNYQKNGIYAYVSNENDTVDIVISSIKPEESTATVGNISPMLEYVFLSALPTMAGDSLVSINGDRENGFYSVIPFNCQKLFVTDPHYNMLSIKYEIVKEAGSTCTCGATPRIDSLDYYCGCREDYIYDGVYNAEGKCLSNTYYNSINLETLPRCCYIVTEIFEEDEETGELVSTNTFNVEGHCTGRLEIKFSEPEIVDAGLLASQAWEDHIAFPPYEELVIDGYNLDNFKVWFYTLVGPAVNSKYYDEMGIDEYFDFNDFSYMFYSLPCKKVTLNNITGFDGFEINDLSHMFANCKNLVSVDFGNFFEGHQPVDISSMFLNCPKLSSVDLSSLDTTRVENMSYMFCINPSRDVIMADIINDKLIPLANVEYGAEVYPTTNNGRPWTWDEAALFMINMDEDMQQQYAQNPELVLKMVKLQIFVLSVELGYLDKIGISYDELAMLMSDFECATFDEFVDYVNQDPSIVGLEPLASGYSYSAKTIRKALKTMAESFPNVCVGTENEVANFYYGNEAIVYQDYQEEEVERETYIQQIIASNMASGNSAISKASTIVTWEDYALNFIASNETWQSMYNDYPEETLEKAKIQVVFNMFETGELEMMALSYDEFVSYFTAYQILSFDEFVVKFNENPSAFEYSAKESGEAYTAEEIKNILLLEAGKICATKKVSIILGTADEVEVMKRKYLAEITVDETKLVLGGEGSKFVIREGMITDNMFASRFDTLVAPSVEEGLSVNLGGEYETADGSKYNVLTSELANITMNWVEEPLVEDTEDPNGGETPDPTPGEGGGDPEEPGENPNPENPDPNPGEGGGDDPDQPEGGDPEQPGTGEQPDPEQPENPGETPEEPTEDPDNEEEDSTVVLVAAILLGCLIIATGCVAVFSNNKSSLKRKKSIFEIIMDILRRND